MLIILPLLLTGLFIFYIGPAEALESEENISKIWNFPVEPVAGEEPRISPIIGIIGIEQWFPRQHGNVTDAI